MGASQSTSSASRPPSPSSSSRQSRPPFSRRLSSFGRRGARSVAKEKEGLAVREHREEEGSPVVERDEAVQKSSAGSSDEDPDGVGVSEITESAHTGKAGDIAPTPSLPTSPGPPIGYPSPQAISPGHASAEPSYFPPVTTTTESTAHSADTASCPMPQPTPTIILSPPISDPARPQSAAATRSAPTPPRPTHSRHLSLPSPASPSINDRTMSGRLTALLGFSAPGEPTPAATDPTSQLLSPGAAGPALLASDLPSTAADDDTLNGDITDLQARLEAARSELLAGQAELAELRQQRAERAARLDAARAELSERRAELEGLQARRVPVGAMLVIQGLAQTQVTTEPTSEGSSNEPNEISGAVGSEGEMVGGRARRPDVRRRISDGSLFRRRREIQRERGASLDQQARMISGLLTVAAAATANTLLTQTSPPSTPTPSRSGVSGAIQSLLDRLRPSRTPRHGIEQALGQYIRNTVRDRNISQGTGETPVPDVDAGAEFQAFLQGLQGDLVGAVRAYAGSVNSESEEISEGETTEDESTTAQQAEPSEPAGDHTDQTTQEPDLTSEEPNPAVTSIPRFHRQLGQNLPDAQENRFGVSGGGDQPRRLNFFRAHVFPPINGAPTSDGQAASSTGEATSNTSDSSGTTSTNNAATATAEGITPPAPVIDSETIVPCIFIGVRSIRHDPSTTPEDLFNQPDLFNSDSSTSELTSTPSSPRHTSSPLPSSSSSSTPALSRVMSPPVPSTPRSFRDRFLSRLSRSATRTLHRTPTNTYLVYVIGGNYPSNHPVLRIPNLISGGPLSDEDMALISELMGPAKPPTATKADIEQSGLRLVDGSEMRELGEKGEVLDNSTERCLICLGDYGEGEECRVLGCRHGFHKECVDRWLEKGSNSCPACRTEAVERTTVGASQTTQSSSPEVGQTPSLSSPIPVTSVPAAGLDISGPSRLDNID